MIQCLQNNVEENEKLEDVEEQSCVVYQKNVDNFNNLDASEIDNVVQVDYYVTTSETPTDSDILVRISSIKQLEREKDKYLPSVIFCIFYTVLFLRGSVITLYANYRGILFCSLYIVYFFR